MDLVNKMNETIKATKQNPIIAFNQKIAAIPDMVSLTLGEPDFMTPEHIKQAAIDAINNNESHYTDMRGIEALRKSVANFLHRKYNLNYDFENEILITTGVSEGLHATLSAILNPGDTVLLPAPLFSLYMLDITMTGAKPVLIDTTDTDFKLTPDKLTKAIQDNQETVKAIILNYPNNPTGVTYNRNELAKFAEIISKHEIFCISDEIYSELTYDNSHVSMGELLPEQTIVLNGVSKAFAMTGYRIGIIAGPKNIIQKINITHTMSTASANTVAQFASVDAFDNSDQDVIDMKNEYQKRRDYLTTNLQKIGFESATPKGAFYLFIKIPKQFTQNSFEFAYELATKAKIGTIPGAAFSEFGDGYLRISYAASMEDLKLAVNRLKSFMKK
ncbi:aminotransferase class I/II-fold pyridoxal phosphate-dependent enzyme [Lactobacillus sp. S2-2]|uniref:aminotransferase class I/II-fold pyridoxal phosphate-dependent enzyme n=1 Tax=Lactobacillus sp. S2-2 TaxID=2692917 RepID=UPI001F0275FA|nr:aminotransferase class I/II-fold pyridoxal phosphate-dependent enzyme [Lactobacillus sp. S2-2]MCF6514602.1 aminotransferase class I/II-fold pyridoxal phosphate-dependent enzyme [Lactobacillus sp. S2-2]